jgi:hypothetical protein
VIDLAVHAETNSYKETINYNQLQILTINYIQLEIVCAGIEELVERRDSWRYSRDILGDNVAQVLEIISLNTPP